MSIFPKTMEDFQTIELKDLDSIAGGRGITNAEWVDLMETVNKGKAKSKMLKAQGRLDEAKKLEETFNNLCTKYLEDIDKAPEGSPDIYFSTIFKPYL